MRWRRRCPPYSERSECTIQPSQSTTADITTPAPGLLRTPPDRSFLLSRLE